MGQTGRREAGPAGRPRPDRRHSGPDGVAGQRGSILLPAGRRTCRMGSSSRLAAGPSWPAPPPGWQRWVQDHPAISPKTQDSLLAMAGGTAVVLGSLVPWISFDSAGAEVKPGAKAASVVLGLIIVALGFALRAAPLPGRLVAGIATVGLSSLAGLLYVGFILGGLGGVPEPDPFGDIATVTFAPNIGIILAAAGCGAAFVAAIMSFHHRQD